MYFKLTTDFLLVLFYYWFIKISIFIVYVNRAYIHKMYCQQTLPENGIVQ
jgi:hypothetical protein